MAEVLRDGEVVGVIGSWAFNTSSPLDGSVNSVRSLDHFPSNRANVGGGGSEDT